MDILHKVLDTILELDGISAELYAKFGHGRWLQFFQQQTAKHAAVNAPAGPSAGGVSDGS